MATKSEQNPNRSRRKAALAVAGVLLAVGTFVIAAPS
jgi:hypothetical protein